MELLKQVLKKIQVYVGLRIIKTVVAVALCFLVYELRGRQGIPFYSAVSAIWCIRPDINNSKNVALQRILGTAIGAVYGLAVLLLESCYPGGLDEVAGYLLATVFLIPVIVTTVVLKKKDSSYFSCSVFLSTTINHLNDANPQLFVWNRFCDTIIGIVIAMIVNRARIPFRRNNDVLYVPGLDELLLNDHDAIPDYGRRELNRMLDEGMHFTIATMRTPAALIAPLKDVHLTLPIIAMDGAVLYSMKDNSFLKIYPIKPEVVKELTGYLAQQEVHYFVNSVWQDTLFIYYGTLRNEAEKTMFQKLKTSPYRNYLKGYPGAEEEVVYLTLLLEEQTAKHLDRLLAETPFAEAVRWLCYPSRDYPGYYYLKIYDIESSRKKMIDFLKEQVGVSSCMTFGSIPERYDIYTGGLNADEVVRMLRKHYEHSVLPHLPL